MAKLVHKEQSYTGGGSSGLLPHIVITSDAENTITVTTPSGSTITPTSTVSGVWECDVDEYGTYTVDASYDGHDAEETVNVDTVKVYPVEIHVTTVPNGSTVLPTDDIETWLACGQITGKSYTTLSQVLDDAETYERLLSDSNACDYMKRSTTWASTICADADAMMRLGKYDYACDALLANSTWASAIANSTYFEYVLDVSVPVMTSNTTPSGECISYGANPSYPNYYAFDGNDSTYWVGNTPITTGAWIGYVFPTSVNVRVIKHLSSVGVEVTAEVEYSDDGTTYESTNVQYNISGSMGEKTINTPNCGSHRYWRTNVVSAPSANGFATKSLQFYGRHTAQTDIIVTAHGGDTVYYMENGSPVTLTTADSDTGIGTVDWSDLPKGAITLYSSTAKNPSDLTADYSKTVYVTEYTTQIYLMPENTLYWYGYQAHDYTLGLNIASNNYGSATSATASTYKVNAYLAKDAGLIIFTGSSVKVSAGKVTAIVNMANTTNGYRGLCANGSLTMGDPPTHITGITTFGQVVKVEVDNITGDNYVGLYFTPGTTAVTNCDIFAIFYEIGGNQ